jgi:uncharacterized cupin superfamily protein
MKQVFVAAALLWVAPAAAAEAPKPVVVTAEEAKGGIFASPKAIIETKNGHTTKWVEMLQTKDKSSAGIYAATASNEDIAAYPEDEFMYFLEGGVTLTSADGTVITVKAGDGVTIPKGWKGNWTTAGYRKFYVTFGGK